MARAGGSAAVIARRPETRLTLREAHFDDYDQIAAVESSQGLTPRPRERWLRLWRGNPAFEETPGWPIGWVLEDSEGRIVGSMGSVPSRFCLGGRSYLAAAYIGWAVDPAHRARSLLLVAHSKQHPGVDLEMVTTAGPSPQAIFLKLGWSRVPVGQWDRAAMWVTNYAGAAEQYLDKKAPPLVARVAGAVLRIPLRIKDAIGAGREIRTGYELDWRNGFGEDFDRFWIAQRESNPGVLLAARDSASLRWHFEEALANGRARVLTASRGGALAGYLIMLRKDAQSMSLTRMILVDFQTLGSNPQLRRALFDQAIRRCWRERIHVLENTGCWLASLHPAAARPSQYRTLECWSYLYRASAPALGAALRNPACWYPTLYDGDASL
jgi:hypothetical protein